MNVDSGDAGLVKKILWPNETVIGTVRQRRVGPGGSVTVPTSVILTNERIIIVNRATLGIRHDYEVIPYSAITTVRLEQGVISSSVFIRVQGYDTDKGLLKNGKQEGEIDGLHGADASDLADFLNDKLHERVKAQEASMERPTSEPDNSVGGYIFCNKCGTKNPGASAFCSKCGAPLASTR